MTVIYEEQAAEHIHGICLKTGPPRLVGVELEWLVRDARDPALPVQAERILNAVAAFAPASGLPSNARPGVLPSGTLLTTEPGGQLELSSQPADSLADCVRATAADLATLRAAVGGAGLELAGIGLDPVRPPRRILDLPRYAAMERFFDRGGPWGRQMMCGTASVQVCLDAGDDGDGYTGYRWRWHLLHAIGPVLVAAFANSPLRGGRPTGWQSSRQQVWAHMDPGRTRPPRLNGARNGQLAGGLNGARNGSGGRSPAQDPREAWVRYVLDAQVMCVRDPGSDDWSAPPGLTLRDWVRGRPQNRASVELGTVTTRLRAPTTEDLAYHVSTLFPPVRPHGHLELRMIDAQPGDGWIVPLALTSALLGDEQAGAAAMVAAELLWAGHGPAGEWPDGRSAAAGADGENPWSRGARLGPADPAIARASRDCFAAARSALDRMAAPAEITSAVDAFIERYVSKDRCPADDLLEEAT
jgi:ergothioneine biosynthesis glutamate--cysteine ligase EgtA